MTGSVLVHVLEAAAVLFERPVLGTENFFTIGGDSLLAAELAVALEEQLGRAVDPEVILTSANLAALALALTQTHRIPESADHA